MLTSPVISHEEKEGLPCLYEGNQARMWWEGDKVCVMIEGYEERVYFEVKTTYAENRIRQDIQAKIRSKKNRS